MRNRHKHITSGILLLLLATAWPLISQFISQLIAAQPFAVERLALVRQCLCATVVLLLLFGPYDRFYVDTDRILYKPTALSRFIPPLGKGFYFIKILSIASGILFGLGYYTVIYGIIFTLSFGLLNFYVSRFSTVLWQSNTHLNIFAAVICVAYAGTGNPEQLAAFAIAFMQVYVVTTYLQATLSKLFVGGIAWFTTGQSIRVATILNGTGLGKRICKYPVFFKIFGIGTAIMQLGIVAIFLLPVSQHWIVWLALAFHLVTYIIMRISFWFLFSLLPALFLIYNHPSPMQPVTMAAPTVQTLIIAGTTILMLLHTIYNRNNWPVSSHNMFCNLFPTDLLLYSVILHEDGGHTQVVTCGSTVPIEYFRANGLFGNIYFRHSDIEQQNAFAVILLKRLNEQPWRYFDEMEPAAKPEKGSRFTGFDLAIYRYNMNNYKRGMKLKDYGTCQHILYSYHT